MVRSIDMKSALIGGFVVALFLCLAQLSQLGGGITII